MITRYFVVEHHGQFISRFCNDVTLLIGDLSSARLFPTVESARETAQVTSLRLGVHPAELKVRGVHADLDTPHQKITISTRCPYPDLGAGRAGGATHSLLAADRQSKQI
jgi:hypothetical protein